MMVFRVSLGNPSEHLGEEQLCEPLDRCPICEGREVAPVLRLQAGPDVSLFHCKHCEGCFADRMPTTSALTLAYGMFL